METELKLFPKLLTILIIPICLFVFALYGWSAFSTITGRSGLNGNMYMYYNVSWLAFSLYTFFVSLLGLLFTVLQLYYLAQKKAKLLTRTFWICIIFIGLVILCEIYLQSRFVGKG